MPIEPVLIYQNLFRWNQKVQPALYFVIVFILKTALVIKKKKTALYTFLNTKWNRISKLLENDKC